MIANSLVSGKSKNSVKLSLIAFTMTCSIGPVCMSAFASSESKGSASDSTVVTNEGDLETVLDSLTKALKKSPEDWRLYSDRGVVHSKLGDEQSALSDFNKAIAMNPPSSKPYFNRGKVESELEMPEAAIKDYNVANKLDPNEPMILNNRANDEVSLGELSVALADYKKAIDLDPEYSEPYNGLGCLLFEHLGNDTEALSNFNKAIRNDPGYAQAFYNRHKVKLAVGDTAGAIRDLQRCAELYESVGQLELCDQVLDDAKALMRSSHVPSGLSWK